METRLGSKAAGGQEFDEHRHEREQLNVRIVQVQLDENCPGLIVDPLQLVQLRHVRLQVRQPATKLVDVATAAVDAVIAHVDRAVPLVTGSILERLLNGYRGIRQGVIGRAPARRKRAFLFVDVSVAIGAFSCQTIADTARASVHSKLPHRRPSDQSGRSVVEEATQIARSFAVVPRLCANVRQE